MLHAAKVGALLGLVAGPTLAQEACVPQEGDLFTRDCIEARDRLANEGLLERLRALCADVGGQIGGRGVATWTTDVAGGRCGVTLWAETIVGGDGISLRTMAMQSALSAGIVGRDVAGGGVVGGGSSQFEVPDELSRFIAENGLVLMEQDALTSTLRGLRDLDLIGRAGAAGIPIEMLDLDAVATVPGLPDDLELDGATDPAAPDLDGLMESLEGPGEGGG